MRREDIEEVLGDIETPDVAEGQYLLDILFQVGPVRGEGPLYEDNLEPWERRRGIELDPWEADLVLDLSRVYLTAMHSAREYNALPPWPPAVKMWKYVRDHINGPGMRAALDDEIPGKGKTNGNRKRR